MSIGDLLLGAILGAFIFVPVGYIVRVWLSRATESVSRSPCVDEIYENIATLISMQDEERTRVGTLADRVMQVESRLTLMSNEMGDFFDKTRKSEERQRGLTRRAEAAIGDEEDTSESDERMLALMEERAEEQATPVTGAFDSREAYYAAERQRLGL